MLNVLIQFIATIYHMTWFIWPFVFILSLVKAISSSIKDEEASKKHVVLASVSLLIILTGILLEAEDYYKNEITCARKLAY